MKKNVIAAFILVIVVLFSISYADDLAETDPLVFVGVNNNYPYLFYDHNGTASGIVVDIMNEIADREGLTVEYYLVRPDHLMAEFEQVSGDILFHGNYLEYTDSDLTDTVTFLSIRNHIFTTSNFNNILNLDPLDNPLDLKQVLTTHKVGIKDLTLHKNKMSEYIPTDKLVIFNNYSDGVKSLMDGKIDVLVMPEFTGKTIMDEFGYSDLLINSNHLFLESYYFSTRDSDRELLNLINKDILIMRKEGFLTKVADTWLSSTKIKNFDSKYLWYFNLVVVSAIAFIVYLIYRSNLLKSTVEVTTNKLEEQRDINKELYKQLLDHEKFKNDYFINLSHELRTPLNVILGASQLIDTYISKENYAKLIENAKYHNSIVKNNGYRLLRVINNIIDINKFDINEYRLNIDFVDIVYVIEQIVDSTKSYVEMKNLSLNFITDIDEKIIECDPFEIDRVFMNLLSNAIKFSKDHGEIKIVLEDHDDKVVIRFIDNGIGISHENHKKIFERFAQVNTELNRSHEGNGIGLSLVKSIIDLHGGDIDLVSEVGLGSEFIVTLPSKTTYHFERDSQIYNDSLNKQYYVDLEFSELNQDTRE